MQLRVFNIELFQMSLNDPVEQAKQLLNITALYEATFKIACMQRAVYEAYIDAGFQPDQALMLTREQFERMNKIKGAKK